MHSKGRLGLLYLKRKDASYHIVASITDAMVKIFISQSYIMRPNFH